VNTFTAQIGSQPLTTHYTGRKISASLSYVTISGKGKMGKKMKGNERKIIARERKKEKKIRRKDRKKSRKKGKERKKTKEGKKGRDR
jgi:hypothetical protein